MEKQNIAYTIDNKERVASIYADTYFNDSFCMFIRPEEKSAEITVTKPADTLDEWKSPSDLIIDIINLTPPFTSKITRGKTHEGILAIGNAVLQAEQGRFLKYLKKLTSENDIAWNHILEHEKAVVAKKVKQIYQDILMTKSKTLMSEINKFYESTLQELEDHLRKEVATVLDSAHANIVSDLNVQIKENLEKERITLEDVLKLKYENEVQKIKHYYKLLLDNEHYRNNKLINKALYERNDALKTFYRQIEAENITGTMYVMCTERKKCRIKQFLLSNYQNAEISEKLQKIKERQDVINAFKEKEKHISDINKDWEDKMKKILHLFLKFVSFSLKLLPEQTTFLLDLEKMVVLQLNEIQKNPTAKSSILIDENECNYFKFEETGKAEAVYEDPFLIIGDTSDSIPTPHASRETLASNVELPIIKLNWPFMPPRQLIYAKCEKFEEVKALLDSKRCKCRDRPLQPETPQSDESSILAATKSPSVVASVSSNEPLLMDDIKIFHDCPARRCENWGRRFSFPYLDNYLDYTDKKYDQIKTIFSKSPKQDITPELIDPKNIIMEEFPFSATHEKFHNIGTQYSSQEDMGLEQMTCPCTEEVTAKINRQCSMMKESPNEEIDQILIKRKLSLQRLIHENPNLLKVFTDESFDFIYSIK